MRHRHPASVPTAQPCGYQPGPGRASAALRHGQGGFTLVELVLVIALAGVVAVMISTVLSRPLQGFVDQSRRAELTDQAATALNLMVRELRRAVPNSVRESPGGLDFLPIHEMGRYEESASGPLPGCDATGCRIRMLTELDAGRVAGARWAVIYNLGAESGGVPIAGQNLWAFANPGVITPQGASFAWDHGSGQLTLQDVGAFRFAWASPQRRLYLAREALRYRCESGVLWRETFDTLDLAQTPRSRAPLADAVAACEFTYQPGSHARQGLVTLRLSLSRDGETIRLVQQVHVDNAP